MINFILKIRRTVAVVLVCLPVMLISIWFPRAMKPRHWTVL